MDNNFPYNRDSAFWQPVEKAVRDLLENDDLELKTDVDYIIGYIVKNLEETE